MNDSAKDPDDLFGPDCTCEWNAVLINEVRDLLLALLDGGHLDSDETARTWYLSEKTNDATCDKHT